MRSRWRGATEELDEVLSVRLGERLDSLVGRLVPIHVVARVYLDLVDEVRLLARERRLCLRRHRRAQPALRRLGAACAQLQRALERSRRRRGRLAPSRLALALLASAAVASAPAPASLASAAAAAAPIAAALLASAAAASALRALRWPLRPADAPVDAEEDLWVERPVGRERLCVAARWLRWLRRRA